MMTLQQCSSGLLQGRRVRRLGASDVTLSWFGLACPLPNYFKMQNDSNSNNSI